MSFPNRPWTAIATGSQASTPKRRALKTVEPVELPQDEPEEPLDNPLPGNMSPRAKQSVPAGRWQDRRKLKTTPGHVALTGHGTKRMQYFFGKQDGWGA